MITWLLAQNMLYLHLFNISAHIFAYICMVPGKAIMLFVISMVSYPSAPSGATEIHGESAI
jgi:hypothetical protein